MATYTCKYANANHLGYKFFITRYGHNEYDQLAFYHKDNFPDVVILRPNTDLSKLHTKALMTVNGYIYPTMYVDSKLYIRNVTNNMLKSRNNHIGIISFADYPGELDKIKITTDMISTEPTYSLYNRAIITFNKDIERLILVIAGYLIFENTPTLTRISNRDFVLNLSTINYLEKIYELARYRNIFTDLDLPTSTLNPSVFDANLARSDAVVLKFLTLNNSFAVNLEVDDLRVNPIYLDKTSVPANYRCDIKPVYPIMAGYGKFVEYIWRKNNDTKYNIYTDDAYYNNHLFTYQNQEYINTINDHRNPNKTYRLSSAKFLKIEYDV